MTPELIVLIERYAYQLYLNSKTRWDRTWQDLGSHERDNWRRVAERLMAEAANTLRMVE